MQRLEYRVLNLLGFSELWSTVRLATNSDKSLAMLKSMHVTSLGRVQGVVLAQEL